MAKTRIVEVNDNGDIHYEVEIRQFWWGGWAAYVGGAEYAAVKFKTYHEALNASYNIESSKDATRKIIKK